VAKATPLRKKAGEACFCGTALCCRLLFLTVSNCADASRHALPQGLAALRTNDRRRMDYFAQQLINGLVLGSIYGLIAIGYTMVYGIVGMINFAHGDIFMIGGFIALISFLILVSMGLTAVPVILLLVLLVSMAITALYGWTVERIAYRPLRHSFRLAPMLSAIGMSFVLTN
jgi:ABC-type branched-subunit amino acid transport system permease subunit